MAEGGQRSQRASNAHHRALDFITGGYKQLRDMANKIEQHGTGSRVENETDGQEPRQHDGDYTGPGRE